MVNCGKCGTDGHVARDCEWESEAGGRPPWCVECERDTRLIDHGSYMQRCIQCWAWPAKGTKFHQLMPQHKPCGGCRTIIYEFDKSPCGKHIPLGIDHRGHRAQPEPPPPAAAYLAARPPSLEPQP